MQTDINGKALPDQAVDIVAGAVNESSDFRSGIEQAITPVPIERLTPYAGNARTHTKKQIRQLAKSIDRFGFTNPVLVDDGGVIVAGHGRVEAAKLLGMKTVPTLRLSHLSESEKRAYVLADNRLAEKAGWDRELLAIELEALLEVDFDVEIAGFEAAEIDIIIDDANEAKDDKQRAEDEAPDPIEGPPVSRRGDLWLLGKHRLVRGDARDLPAYDHLLKGEKAEFVFTDPPYNVQIDGNVCGKGVIRHREFEMASGEMTDTEFTGFLSDTFRCLAAHTTDGSIHAVCVDWRHLNEMITAGSAAYSELKNLCVWNKTNAGMGTFYRNQHELVFLWKSGTAAHVNNFELGQHGRSRSNVWTYAGINTMRPGRLDELAMHPTVKPVRLVADAIKDCSHPSGLVLDAFCGSGTILIAAERTGRKARAIEIDPQYVDVSIRRWQTYTGKLATLAASGQSFEAVQGERSQVIPPANSTFQTDTIAAGGSR